MQSRQVNNFFTWILPNFFPEANLIEKTFKGIVANSTYLKPKRGI